MAHETAFFQLPCGARGVLLEMRGILTGEETAALLKEVAPGGALHGLPALVLTKDLASIAPDARGLAARRERRGTPEVLAAVVATNPVIRVSINFIFRIVRLKRARLFAGEPEAIQWLDERAREQAAKTGAP